MVDPFAQVTPTPDQFAEIVCTRAAYRVVADALSRLPECRQQAVAQEYLEMSAMWANKAITHGVPK
jgi:hypothetical protein